MDAARSGAASGAYANDVPALPSLSSARRRGRSLRRAQSQLFFLAHALPSYFGKGCASRCLRKLCLTPGGLLQRAIWAERCVARPVVLHADNGSAMKGAIMKVTMERLGVIPSLSRPRVSNDNPFSEALFRTCKYVPTWPTRGFASLEAARTWVAGFVRWYNTEHRHSAIRFVTPDQRHQGEDPRLSGSPRDFL
jgi:hypothetical protein